MTPIHKSMFPPGSLGHALCEQREANANVHPLFQEILEPAAFPKGRWTPEPTMAGPVEAESLDTLDAGPAVPSEPDACRHDRFSIGRGKFKCCHCDQIFDFGEDGV